jgi:hypothetical protein
MYLFIHYAILVVYVPCAYNIDAHSLVIALHDHHDACSFKDVSYYS